MSTEQVLKEFPWLECEFYWRPKPILKVGRVSLELLLEHNEREFDQDDKPVFTVHYEFCTANGEPILSGDDNVRDGLLLIERLNRYEDWESENITHIVQTQLTCVNGKIKRREICIFKCPSGYSTLMEFVHKYAKRIKLMQIRQD